MMGDKEVKLIDTELLRTNIAQIAKACAKSDKQKALVGRILFMIENMPTIEAEPVKHGQWVKSNTQRHVEITYECSECQHEVVGEYEKTPFCGGCGARMGGDSE